MTDDDLAEPLLKRMGRLPVTEPSAHEHALRLRRMTRAVERTLEGAATTRRRRRRALWTTATLAAAAGIALFVSSRFPFAPSKQAAQASLLRVTGDVELRASANEPSRSGRVGMQLEPEVELRTASGSSAALALATGAHVSIGPSALVQLPEAPERTPAERIRLGAGHIALSVPPLPAGRTLAVVTSNTTVTVRGTRFSVDVVFTSGELVTSVAVEKGRVEVESSGRHAWLGPGDHWSSRTAAPASTTAGGTEVPEAPLVLTPARPVAAAPGARPSSTPAPVEQSSLAEENRLFEQALRKAQAGSARDALADFDRFVREHPRSPLTQAVRVERLHVLQQLGEQAQAAREARRYLTDYPNGFARDDAKGIALFGVGGSQ